MTIPVKCDSCGRQLKVRDELAGKKGKCPQCGETIRVPSPRLKVAQRLPDEKEAEAQVLEVVSLGEAAEPAAEGFAIDPTFSAARSGTGAATSGATHAAGPRRLQGLPTWAWIVVAAVGVTAAASLGYVVATAGGDKEVAAKGDSGEEASSDQGSGDGGHRYLPISSQPGAKTPKTGSSGRKEEVFDSGLGKRPPPRVAKTMKDVEKAVVKIEIPVGGGMILGTGFIVDGRCWVATNHHVAENANERMRVKFVDGSTARVAGFIADKPEYDLAILKLEDEPSEVVTLDVSYSGTPDPDTDVRAFGHPLNAEFSLTRGVVSRVLSTSKLGEELSNPLLREMHAPDFFQWIQHDAAIERGNSGGPLLDGQYRVLGVNTWVNMQTHFGYASHVRYLRELLQSASGQVTALPKAPERIEGPEMVDFQVPAEFDTPEKLQALFDACAQFEWKPQNAEQYESLCKFANAITRIHMAKQFPQGAGDISPEDLEKLGEAADAKLKEVQSVSWSQEHADAIKAFAAGHLDKVGQGVVAFGTLMGKGTNVVVLKLPDADKGVIVPGVPSELAKSDAGAKIIAFGTVTPGVQQAPGPDGKAITLRMILSRFAVKIE